MTPRIYKLPLPRMLAKQCISAAVTASLALPSWASQASFGVAWAPDPVCTRIAKAISSPNLVHYDGALYDKDISHWAESSTQRPKCTVEPNDSSDVGIILEILGSTNTSFAVKGGGHTANPGFSSTTGVLIAMYRLSEVKYDASTQTVVVGAGLIWEDVYAKLEPHNVTIVGGRVTGVGVAGLTLGGGYSWKSNQHGLTVDTIIAFELVMPNKKIVDVSQESNPDLFFALKGGFNNYGIVTKFILKPFPQSEVWGGTISFDPSVADELTLAVAAFCANSADPKASIIASYGVPFTTLMLFYDGPTPPSGVFEKFLDIKYKSKDISTRTYKSLILSPNTNATNDTRGAVGTVSVLEYTPTLLKAIANESVFWLNHLSNKTAKATFYNVEPLLSTAYNHSLHDSAYPYNRSPAFFPLFIYLTWEDAAFDSDFHDAIIQSAHHIREVAIAEGQVLDGVPLYPNFAISGTSLEDMYGPNLARLQQIRKVVDPSGIMGLAGGWKF